MASVVGLGEALGLTATLVAGVQDDQWALPTPCSEWNVQQLVGHLVDGNRWFAAVMRGSEAFPPPAVEPLSGPVAAAAYRLAADELLDAFRVPGALDREVALPIGRWSGAEALRLRVVETLVHGWDLATATGQKLAPSEDVVSDALDFTRERLGDVAPERRPFGTPQPEPPDATTLERLLALLGRTVPPA